MILQINSNGEANRVFLSKDITEEEYISKYNQNNDLIIYNTKDIPNVSFLKLVDGIIVENIEKSQELEYFVKLQESFELLKRTDYLCLIDNPSNLTSEQLNELFSYRKALRDYNITKIFPTISDFIQNKIK